MPPRKPHGPSPDPCPKCGWEDVAIRWHRSSAECTIAQQAHWGYSTSTLLDEHLHYECSRCHYDWMGTPIDTSD